jgi:SAM-dependent methyltransferase
MLDLVRLSTRLQYPPGGKALCRQIAILTDLAPDDEVLDVACGQGAMIEYFVREHGVQGTGVDGDPTMVERATARVREGGVQDRLQFQHASPENLPFRDRIFDVAVGELGLGARVDPRAAVSELVRVTKPGGRVVLVQLVWLAQVDSARQEVLSQHLGARPMMLVEWKRLLRDAGVENLHTEDWSDEETAFRPRVRKPFPDFAELFSLGEKLGILRRAWRRWGWRGVQAALAREQAVHRLLTRERILGLDLITGARPAGAGQPLPEREEEEREAELVEVSDPSEESDEEETTGLPLFGGLDDAK